MVALFLSMPELAVEGAGSVQLEVPEQVLGLLLLLTVSMFHLVVLSLVDWERLSVVPAAELAATVAAEPVVQELVAIAAEPAGTAAVVVDTAVAAAVDTAVAELADTAAAASAAAVAVIVVAAGTVVAPNPAARCIDEFHRFVPSANRRVRFRKRAAPE